MSKGLRFHSTLCLPFRLNHRRNRVSVPVAGHPPHTTQHAAPDALVQRTGVRRRFHEVEQVLPRGFSDSRHPAKLTNHSSSRHHLRSSWPYAKVLCDSCRVGLLDFEGRSLFRCCLHLVLVLFESVIWYTNLIVIRISYRGLRRSPLKPCVR